MEDYKQSYEIHQRRCEKKGTELAKQYQQKLLDKKLIIIYPNVKAPEC